MKWEKGICSICDSGEAKSIDVFKHEVPTQGVVSMCKVCYGLGLPSYRNQAYDPASRIDISRAVRYLLDHMKKPQANKEPK
jgi:hypothetical protein